MRLFLLYLFIIFLLFLLLHFRIIWWGGIIARFKKDINLTKYVLLYILFVLTFIITIYAVK